MTFDRPVTIQRMDDSEEWHDVATVHARVNKTTGGQFVDAGSMRTSRGLTFDVRWAPWAREMATEAQRWRVVYEGHTYSVEDTDDYMERHRVLSIEGALYDR